MITVFAATMVIIKVYLLKCRDDVVLQLVHNVMPTPSSSCCHELQELN